MGNKQHSTRRQFLGHTAGALGGALATPYFITSARAQAAAKADRFVIGSIGMGSQGRNIMRQAMDFADVAAVCDLDASHALEGRQDAGGRADVYADYRRVLDREDIQAVTIATPDHWHTKIAIDALHAGKHVYCEKPLTLTIEEGQLICQAVKKTGKTFQVGTQQRSENDDNFLRAIALIRAGRLGKIKLASCGINNAPASPAIPVASPPGELDWERWLGQAPLVDYRVLTSETDIPGFGQKYYSRCHYEFRWWYEYSGGKMTDWGAHHVDIAVWALEKDTTGPDSVRVVSSKHPVPFKDGMPQQDDRYNVATDFHVVAKYPDVEIEIRSDTDNGVLFEGEKGRIFVNREKLTGKPVEELTANPLPEDAVTKIYKGRERTGHMANFFECIKAGEQPISDVFSHHRALSVCHLANIALRLDREIKWDPTKEQMIGDDQAQALCRRDQRPGYELPKV